jgi:hypothetical protein
LYELHNDGAIWQYTGTVCQSSGCPGWQELDNNSRAIAIAAQGGNLFELHNDGWIWQYTGTVCKNSSCPGWNLLDDNPRATAIAASGSNLYELHNGGSIWRFTGGLSTASGSSGTSCAPTDDCTPATFAEAILNYPGINAPVTDANIYALDVWEAVENGGAGCTAAQPPHTARWPNSPGPAGNPLNTARREPGSTDWNSVPVQIYHDGNGNTCWGWGIKGNGDALTDTGFYTAILNILKNPSSDNHTQCVNLARAVAASPWGTSAYEGACQ